MVKMSAMEVQDNCKMRNSNRYVVRGLQNEINVELQDNCEMRNNNKYVVKKLEYPERTNDHGQATGTLDHLWLRIERTLFVID
jgi:hypothetical protein